MHQDLEKPLELNGTIKLHNFSVKIWKKTLLICEGLRLQARVLSIRTWERFAVLASTPSL